MHRPALAIRAVREHPETRSVAAGAGWRLRTGWREKLSAMVPDAQFQVTARYPGNWDRCRRCGAPRLMHGGDESCGISLGSRVVALLVVSGGVLAVIGAATWMLVTAPAIPAASVIAFACLVLLALLVGGLALPARRR
jgi:hypothetical protein